MICAGRERAGSAAVTQHNSVPGAFGKAASRGIAPQGGSRNGKAEEKGRNREEREKV